MMAIKPIIDVAKGLIKEAKKKKPAKKKKATKKKTVKATKGNPGAFASKNSPAGKLGGGVAERQQQIEKATGIKAKKKK